MNRGFRLNMREVHGYNYKSNNGGRLPDWEYMKGNRELQATVGSSKDIPLLSYAEAAGIPEGTHFKIFINYLMIYNYENLIILTFHHKSNF